MKVAIVYTGTSPQMISLIENELKLATKGEDLQIIMYTDPTIINETIANSRVTASAAKRLVKMYIDAVTAGAEIVYNICSSIRDVADAVKKVFEIMEVPFIRVDEDMAINAIKMGKRIGVLATLRTALDPTKGLVKRCAQEMGIDIEVIDALADGAFGKPQEELEQILIEKACSISDRVDIILLAQVSVAACEEKIAQATGKTILSSPRFGAMAVAKEITKLKNKH